MEKGDLVKCFNWQYFGAIGLVLEVEDESALVYMFDDKRKKRFHKSLLSLFKRSPPEPTPVP
jgi:hypothetical protein